MLRFQGHNLSLKPLVLFRQPIAGSCHCFEIVSQSGVLSLKFHHQGLQWLVQLQSFCVLAGCQEQTQHYRYSKSHPSLIWNFQNIKTKSNLEESYQRTDAPMRSSAIAEILTRELYTLRRRKTPNLTIHQFCKTANFYASARNCVATGFQLFGGNTAGQNVRVGCAKSIPT